MEITEGDPSELGARPAGDGVNFAVRSADACAIELCLFDPGAEGAERRLFLPGRTGEVFHGFVPGLRTGAAYGLRAHGPYRPAEGLRFNPAKLLIDPYALQLDRQVRLSDALFEHGGDEPDPRDSAPYMARSLVVAPQPGSPRRPRRGLAPVIYELNVRGFTRLMTEVPSDLRGTFRGLAHPAAVHKLARLGVTCVELMPSAAWTDERHLPGLGLSNAWGYNPVALMAPDPRLAPGGWADVRAATDALWQAGIETILDVVLNHTGESDALGPTLSLRGLDNRTYYRLPPHEPGAYLNDAGCGNTLNLQHPAGLRLAMDALRTWASLGGLSGFRFDLAVTLARQGAAFSAEAAFLGAVQQDPLLKDLRLIAEPWDCGPEGYQLGRFPAGWGEWNDRFRDEVRTFWGLSGTGPGALASRLAGSQDIFGGRRPSCSVNYVVAHDGFTLADLTAYSAKANHANGEENRDGSSHEISWNNGVEGPSEDPEVQLGRKRDQRALLALGLLSRGAAFLPMGFEVAHSQAGNNNAYAQDNHLTWIDWARDEGGLADLTARLTGFRLRHAAIHADRFLSGEPHEGAPFADVVWSDEAGRPLSASQWEDPAQAVLVASFCEPGPSGGWDRACIVINRGHAASRVQLPSASDRHAWTIALDTCPLSTAREPDRRDRMGIGPRSVVALEERPEPSRRRDVGVDLSRLAHAAGVVSTWHELDGKPRAAEPDTVRALLRAMGLAASGAGEISDSLASLAERDHRPLPFSHNCEAGAPFSLPLRTGSVSRTDRVQVEIRAAGEIAARVDIDLGRLAREPYIGCDGRGGLLLRLPLPALGAGRYVVDCSAAPGVECRLTVAPLTCHLPEPSRRILALSAQLYGVRTPRDQGVGDFTTLGELGASAGAAGLGLLAVNPLHGLFPADRGRASPYYPSDRRRLDPIYIDVSGLPGGAGADAQALNRLAYIDYDAVWRHKDAVLRRAFEAQPVSPGQTASGPDPALDAWCLYQAIAARHGPAGARAWPSGLQGAAGEDIARFRAENIREVAYHRWLQELAEAQLATAARAGQAAGCGLARDLAVGAAPDGAEVWASQGRMASGVSLGAPPDPFAPQGQVWGLSPFNPLRLAQEGYASLAELIASNMAHAQVLRIDHVLGLFRQFWVAEGAQPSQGAYVRLPAEALLAEVCLESRSRACAIIGEDLGTTPEGLRETLARHAVLGYRVLPFEKDAAGFRGEEAYPVLSWACVSTHDLPPVRGWWRGVDITERAALGVTDADQTRSALEARKADAHALEALLVSRGLLEPGAGEPETGPAAQAPAAGLVEGLHAFIAQVPSLVAAVQLEDLAGAVQAVNLPGTDQERPNWRLRLDRDIDAILADPAARALLERMRLSRP